MPRHVSALSPLLWSSGALCTEGPRFTDRLTRWETGGHFHCLALANKGAMDVCIRVVLWTCFFICLERT